MFKNDLIRLVTQRVYSSALYLFQTEWESGVDQKETGEEHFLKNFQKSSKLGAKYNSWLQIKCDGDDLLMPYIPISTSIYVVFV